MLYITLYMDDSDRAPRGPGWYIQSTWKDGHLPKPVSITQEGASELASAFQRALQTTDEEIPNINFPQAVNASNSVIIKALEESLRHAEEQAAKIPLLRQRLAKAPPPPAEIERPTA